ncbi:putative peptidyl-prolyl cis-trans isomerase [termite gut metagenome]|uniref:peptidylprolyl isomerase n=1 Tax=termite gut metagenome TaxID=433724 RepID=A0A5J4SY31_9ZZZZ
MLDTLINRNFLCIFAGELKHIARMTKIISILVSIILISSSILSCQSEQKKGNMLRIETNLGDIIVRLYDETPQHRDNFIKLAKNGTYNSTLFHRVIKDFMIQAGDPKSKGASKNQPLGSGDVDYKLPAEIVFPQYFHKKGALAAARQGDNINPKKESSGCQFYIVTGRVIDEKELSYMEQMLGIQFTPEQVKAYTTIGGVPHLDNGYTVFGEVTKGLDVVDKIQRVPTGNADRPMENVVIKKVVVL